MASEVPRVHRLYIDGKWLDADSGARYELPNPATEECVGLAPDAGRSDMQRAIAAARRAFDEGPWPRTKPRERARTLEAIADALERRKEEFRTVLVSAHAAEFMTHGIQLDTPIASLRAYADLVQRFEFEESLPSLAAVGPTGPAVTSAMVHHQPAGVCGLIPTWNFPLYVTLQKIAPALAAGCTMVCKPSPWGPLIDLMVAELLEEANVPPGVFNVVTGQSDELGIELCTNPGIDKLSFTGSVSTGKRVMESAAATLKRVHLELGGKSAMIILDDADMAMAGPSASAPTFFHAGQGCAITTRVLVKREQHDALVAGMEAFVKSFVKIGNPADPATILGPVIRDERRCKIEEYIQSGIDDGAELVLGGGRPAGFDKGYFLEPTIFANVDNDMRIAREEIFGPVVAVIPYVDDADAVRIANDSDLGLYGGIMTSDTHRALGLAKQIRSGGVSINGAVNLEVCPFGGFKQSGIGREGGVFGLREYLETQAITWRS
jgi:acyl-CoA reductase-like NAD-dependent aldehyde dehydrogenase